MANRFMGSFSVTPAARKTYQQKIPDFEPANFDYSTLVII